MSGFMSVWKIVDRLPPPIEELKILSRRLQNIQKVHND